MNSERYKGHILFEKLNQLTERIKDDESLERIDSEHLLFISSAIQYLHGRLNASIPELVQEQELNAMQNEVDAALQQINAFFGNNNQGHITNCMNNLNAAISRVRNFPMPIVGNEFDFAKAAAEFQSVLMKKSDAMEARISELQDQSEQLESEVEKKSEELTQLSNKLEAKEKELEVLNAQFQTNFTSIQTKSQQEISQDRTSFRTEIDELKKTFSEEFEQDREEFSSDSKEIIEDLQTKLNEAEKIVGVIGNVGVTGNYQKVANEHKTSADNWRYAAMGFMVILSALLIWTIVDLSGVDYDWTKSVIRILGAAALSYPATYAARESSKHRKLETHNRTAELELASINPFIESLDEKKQQEIKEKLVEKYFGNSTAMDAEDATNEEVSLNVLERIVKLLSQN